MAAKKFTSISLAEILKRVPSNQMQQFETFRNKTVKYHDKVNQYPEKLPHIDWEFYRHNVREDYVKIVEQFQIKYEELKHFFASRNEALDFSKYYKELDEQSAQAQEDVKNYIEQSNARIAVYENEINRIKSLVPYENMTLEQFVTEREDIAKYIPGQGKALFWPHEPSEQCAKPNIDDKNADCDKEQKTSEQKTSFKSETTDDKDNLKDSLKSLTQNKPDINTA